MSRELNEMSGIITKTCENRRFVSSMRIAEALYNAGYRKQSENIIELPCKVGDKVWFLNTHYSIAMYRNAVYEAKVVRVYVEKGNILCLSIQVKNEMGTTEYPRITEIGKTVFFTKKEAEKALAKMKGGAK